MLKLNLIILISLILSKNCLACLNGETKVLKNGYFVYEDFESMIPHGHEFDIPKGNSIIKELDSLYQITNDLDYLSDIGYVYIIQGKYNEALKIYLKMESIAPNRYSTASNIGTIYELIGENKKTLNWINKSIQIDAKAHNNSEWLHSKILEAKIKGKDFIDTVSGSFFINTHFGTKANPKCHLDIENLRELIDALYYQLHERMTFIKKEDRIIALLLFEMGNALVDRDISTEPQHEELEIYKKAKYYGFNNPIIDKRIQFVENANTRKTKLLEEKKEQARIEKEKHRSRKSLFYKLLYSFIGAVCVIIFVVFLKKRRE